MKQNSPTASVTEIYTGNSRLRLDSGALEDIRNNARLAGTLCSTAIEYASLNADDINRCADLVASVRVLAQQIESLAIRVTGE